MTRPGPRRRDAPLLGLLAALLIGAVPARATDCAGLRAAIDAADAATDPARVDASLQRQRDEIIRTRAAADRTGCGDGVFDDPDSEACRALARRVEMLQVGLQRLRDRASGVEADDDGRRSDLQARFDAECAASAAPDAPGIVTVPVDPDAPAGPAAPRRAGQVYCVRRCDGAYYPLAADVGADRMADMDRVCQAQCPAAASSAYAGEAAEGVSNAVTSDGTRYSALATAFRFQNGSTGGCACRAPHQSWAEALAGAEALLEPHRGDVTVTAELAAAMARPAQPSPKAAPAASAAAARPARKKGKAVKPSTAPPDAVGDLTPGLRRGDAGP